MTTYQSYRGGQQHNLELGIAQKLYQNSWEKMAKSSTTDKTERRVREVTKNT